MELHISKNLDELSTQAADWIVASIDEVLQTQDRFTIALSGGSTPKKLHELLVTPAYKNKIDWQKLHVFCGDERFVPFSDEGNNARMAFETLLKHVPVPQEQIHVMPTENIKPEAAAAAYEQTLKKYFEHTPHTFDLILLGMGDDGHTLSLFPGQSHVIHEQDKWCTSLWLESQQMFRITITHPVANNAARIAFLTAGANKAKALFEVLNGDFNPDKYPSQMIYPEKGTLHWFVDEAAAAELE